MGKRSVTIPNRGAATAALLAVAAALTPFTAGAEVLVYKAANKWVAAEDNQPVQKLMQAARGGKTTYTVRLPAANRALAITRLEIIQAILAREARSPIIMEESGPAKTPNTLEIN